MAGTNRTQTVRLPARDIAIPSHLSEAAQAYLASPQPQADYLPIADKAAWRAYVKAQDEAVLPLLQGMVAQVPAEVVERDADGARIFDILPPGADGDDRIVVLEMHGGGSSYAEASCAA